MENPKNVNEAIRLVRSPAKWSGYFEIREIDELRYDGKETLEVCQNCTSLYGGENDGYSWQWMGCVEHPSRM
jgi:hypothetical protein